MKKDGQTNKGFTFLELLIAVTIFSIVAVAVYSSFNVGIHAWRKTEGSYKVKQEARHAFDIMGRDLRCAIDFIRKNPDGSVINSFEGSSAKVSFWRASKDGVIKITYLFDKEAKALYYISQTYKEASGGENGNKSPLAYGISDLKLKYAYRDGENIIWQDDWESKESDIPKGVKASIYYEADNGGGPVEFFDTVLIPTGVVNDVSEQTE